MCVVVLECGCKYYGSSVDAAGGRGSVDKNKQSLATAAARVIQMASVALICNTVYL